MPISMEVLDEFDIEDKNIKTIDDISGITPNFFIFKVGDQGFLAPTIRGCKNCILLIIIDFLLVVIFSFF